MADTGAVPKTIVVIGGVAGGAGAAVKARRTDEKARIIVFEKGPYVSYANCGIPYYVGGDIEDRGDLLLITPERFKRRFNIDVRVNHEAVKIDRTRKEVEIVDLSSGGSFRQPYDKLVIATGSRPAAPSIPGIDGDNIFTLWTVPDADAVKALISAYKGGKALVVGAGFVGLEAVEALLHQGLEVDLVELSPQLMPGFDPEMTAPLAQYLKAAGVRIHLGVKVEAFEGEPLAKKARLSDGSDVEMDMAVIAAGVKPQVRLAVDAGLAIGGSGGLIVDNMMRTSDHDIYAAGDIAESINLVTGEYGRVPLAGPANKQARVAGANAAGGNLEFKGTLGSTIIKVLDLTLAKTGISERDARAKGIPHYCSFTHSDDHAGYYPGSTPMAIKLVAEKDSGRLLGAQILGRSGVDKRVDVLATALYGRMTVEDLENLDLAYAPPYSSAKDPVNVAGMVATNLLRGEVRAVTAERLREMLDKGEDVRVVDVRTPGEYGAGHISGAVNIPLDDLRERYGELDKGKKTVLYCGIAYRSYLALRILAGKGFSDLSHVSGGYKAWKMLY